MMPRLELANGVRMVQLSPELLDLIPLRDPIDAALLGNAAIRADALRSPAAFAMLEGGYVIGAGGVAMPWPGRGIAWILAGRDARPRHMALVVPFVRGLLDHLQGDPAFRRIECTVVASLPASGRYARHLGFELEARLQAFGLGGEDHDLYRRIA